MSRGKTSAKGQAPHRNMSYKHLVGKWELRLELNELMPIIDKTREVLNKSMNTEDVKSSGPDTGSEKFIGLDFYLKWNREVVLIKITWNDQFLSFKLMKLREVDLS